MQLLCGTFHPFLQIRLTPFPFCTLVESIKHAPSLLQAQPVSPDRLGPDGLDDCGGVVRVCGRVLVANLLPDVRRGWGGVLRQPCRALH